MGIIGLDDIEKRAVNVVKNDGYFPISGLGETTPTSLAVSVHVQPWKPPVAGGPLSLSGWLFTSEGAVPAGIGVVIRIIGPVGEKKHITKTNSSGSYGAVLDGSYHPVMGQYRMLISQEAPVTVNDKTYSSYQFYDSGSYDVPAGSVFGTTDVWSGLVNAIKNAFGIK
jgi:hypothetical protein